jgi:metallo-beta-lactamase class B
MAPRFTTTLRHALLAAVAAAAAPASAAAAVPDAWTRPIAPFRIAGDTWYVGTEGITVLLVRGAQGSVLFDAGMPEALPALKRNLATLGVAPHDIKLILTSHAHVDHVGAIAALQAWTGARVLASADSAGLLAAGGRGDLHFGDDLPYPPLAVSGTVVDGESVRLGERSFRMHHTPGHTPGSSSWSWTEPGESGDLQLVYADSLTAPGYRLLEHPRRPGLVAEYRASFDTLRGLDCDVLVTPHPEASGLFDRVDREAAGASRAKVDASGCARYADLAERALEAQIEVQRGGSR